MVVILHPFGFSQPSFTNLSQIIAQVIMASRINYLSEIAFRIRRCVNTVTCPQSLYVISAISLSILNPITEKELDRLATVVEDDELDGAETGSEEEEFYSADDNDADLSDRNLAGDEY